MGNTETGLYLENTCGSPPLNKGMTRTIFSSVGNTPVVDDRLKMCVKGRTI